MTRRPYVLVVDDDEWLAQRWVRLCERAGFRVGHAFHALQAIDMMDESLPSVLVLDLFLPGPNGVVLLHELQSHGDLAQVPVVLCTNSGGDIGEGQLASYGVSRVLDKATMQPEDLLAAVREAVDG